MLPTIDSQFQLKNLITPQEIATSNSLKAQTRQNSATSKWASPISGTLNDEALRAEQEKQEKSKCLEQRRKHLSTILETEKNNFQTELLSHRQSVSTGATRPNFLREISDKEQPKIVDNKFHLNSIEEPKLENLQLDEKRTLYQPQELHQRFDDEQDKQYDRKNRNQQLKIILQQQMDEFNQKEQESEILKQEEERLLKDQWKLKQIEEERKKTEKSSVQPDSGRQLLRQHKAKLHKRAKEIQEQLELDIKILASIAYTNEQSNLEQSEQLKRNVLNTLQQFQQQIKLEREKEQEFDDMYPDDADKYWSRREQEWNHEREIREKLIEEIIEKKKEEIIKKLKLLKQQQEEIHEKQRILINDMEQARKYDLIEKQKQLKEKEISNTQQERENFRLEFEKQNIIEYEDKKQTDKLVQQEIAVNTTTNEPKFYGRRRANWN
ncbi:unnamed protein product [Adineta steineri]|uniref:Trichoplein keratin filament-binding protein n=1 Tax=Adineta steineri TaxID=433720 RepID=A0A819A0A4_9BILA|nr:unnamed protein product [Adineta steineri]